MKCKHILLILILCAICIYIPAVTYASTLNQAKFIIGSSFYDVNSQTYQMDATPFIENDRIYLPVRFLAIALGVLENDIKWLPDQQRIILTKDERVICLTIGSTILQTGNRVVMDVPPIIRDGRTYLPARYVAEAFGYEVSWNQYTQALTLKQLASELSYRWTYRNENKITQALWSVTYGDGIFVAVGDSGTILTSSDGITWSKQNSGTTNLLSGVTYGNGTFVAVGKRGTIMTSPNGITWSSHSMETIDSFLGVSYVNNVFVAVGQGVNIFTSPDGINWSPSYSGSTIVEYFNSDYGNDVFVVVGTRGSIITSANCKYWNHKLFSEEAFHDVIYDNKTFVAVGSTNMIITSDDGLNWTKRSTGFRLYCTLNGIAYGSGYFVVVGSNDAVLYSSDGVNWKGTYRMISEQLRGVAYGNGTFVIVGDRGIIRIDSSDISEIVKGI